MSKHYKISKYLKRTAYQTGFSLQSIYSAPRLSMNGLPILVIGNYQIPLVREHLNKGRQYAIYSILFGKKCIIRTDVLPKELKSLFEVESILGYKIDTVTSINFFSNIKTHDSGDWCSVNVILAESKRDYQLRCDPRLKDDWFFDSIVNLLGETIEFDSEFDIDVLGR